ncbi:unnamed protein product [Adineta steineri]|uniref:CCHC-type domain-containing protein n=1 Tax=Adineta steineri TaxID=433720 RepID=A0A815MYS4_9BILA|nr:unnamed protein product [Adineta steineri]
MTNTEKDNICNGEEFRRSIDQVKLNTKERSTNSLKRMATNEGQQFSINEEDDEIILGQWQKVRPQKSMRNNSNGDCKEKDDEQVLSSLITLTNTLNTNINQNLNQNNLTNDNFDINTLQKSNDYDCGLDNSLKISKHALSYASEYHYPSFKIVCQPKLKDPKQGSKLINELIKSIKDDFMIKNSSFSKPVLFDLWWINPQGDLQIIIKTIELYVYLCRRERYPKELLNIKLDPYPPKHLPPQHTIILKWIHNTISIDDIKEELSTNYESIALIEDMFGTITNRTRHVKIEFYNKIEFTQVLNGGKIIIYGQKYVVDEFIPAPKILICSRCNNPGHVKKNCMISKFDICRRCGEERKNLNDHRECSIKCHHCGGNHISTDYKCKIIEEYRRKLIHELKQHPERLPPDVQLFIPSEYRIRDDKTRLISNNRSNSCTNEIQQSTNNRKEGNVWVNSESFINQSSNINNELAATMKCLSNELKEEKERHERKQIDIQQKFKSIYDTMNQTISLVHQAQQAQQSMIDAINHALQLTLFPSLTKMIEIVYSLIDNLKPNSKSLNIDQICNITNKQLLYINEASKEFCQHQEELKKISSKQNDAFNMVIDSIHINNNV